MKTCSIFNRDVLRAQPLVIGRLCMFMFYSHDVAHWTHKMFTNTNWWCKQSTIINITNVFAALVFGVNWHHLMAMAISWIHTFWYLRLKYELKQLCHQNLLLAFTHSVKTISQKFHWINIIEVYIKKTFRFFLVVLFCVPDFHSPCMVAENTQLTLLQRWKK